MAPIIRTLVERDDSGCEGWGCYSSSQQAGIVFMAITVPVVAGFVFWFGLIKPNLSYWQSISSDAKRRQEMEQEIRENALSQLPRPQPPPEPTQEQKAEERPSPPQEDPPPQAKESASSPTAPLSPTKGHKASEDLIGSFPVTIDDVSPIHTPIHSPISLKSQPAKPISAKEAQSAPGNIQSNEQQAQTEPEFRWGENISEMQQPGQGEQVPRMPFPPFLPFLHHQRSQHLHQQQYPQTAFHPVISVLPPPPPPPRFATTSQHMPGSFPDQPAYYPPPQPTYAPSAYTTAGNERQQGTSASFTTKSTSFPMSLFSRSRKSKPSHRALTESDLGLDRVASGGRSEMALSPMALPSETSSGESKREVPDEPEREHERRESGRHGDKRCRERSQGNDGSSSRSGHSLESRHSRDEHGRRHLSHRQRHDTRHSPHSRHRHRRRRAQRESSRSCSPDRHRLQERPVTPKRSRFAFLAPLLPIALGALGVVTEARAHEQRKRLREAEEFSIRHRSPSLERNPIGRRSDDRARIEHRRSLSRGLLEGAIRALDEHAPADSALDINRDAANHRRESHRIRYHDQDLRGGDIGSDSRSGRNIGQWRVQGNDSGKRRRVRKQKANAREDDRSTTTTNSGSTMSSTYWRFRDSDSLRRHEGIESIVSRRPEQ